VEKKGARVVGISTDSTATLKKFKEEFQLPFALLSDADGKVADQYAGRVPVIGLANLATYVVDQAGTISSIVTGSEALDPTSAISACPTRKGGGP
jgi:peroxiredoxin Q/BCP